MVVAEALTAAAWVCSWVLLDPVSQLLTCIAYPDPVCDLVCDRFLIRGFVGNDPW